MTKCTFDPTADIYKNAPIGMFHCPECGEMVLAGMPHPDWDEFYKNRPMNFFEKLQVGWWWIGEIFDEWCYTMRSEDGEFFNYLQSDYVKYEEDMYYQDTSQTEH